MTDSTTQQVVATLAAPLQNALQSIIAQPTQINLTAQALKIGGDLIAAAVSEEPAIITMAAQHLLAALNNAIAATPSTPAATTLPPAK